ncbi:hypothetical protein T10_10462 [Trichinella papuae]|uniref:Uncharacterized protein n=1 Tax=Trichinella papuae TaxID=268474 RepID=A0A0V1M4Y8_9BILA|nr:hypothetical protein T10_10462 [Trichinella papuae]
MNTQNFWMDYQQNSHVTAQGKISLSGHHPLPFQRRHKTSGRSARCNHMRVHNGKLSIWRRTAYSKIFTINVTLRLRFRLKNTPRLFQPLIYAAIAAASSAVPFQGKLVSTLQFTKVSTVKVVQNFIRMANFNHRFTTSASLIIQPLYKALAGQPVELVCAEETSATFDN